MKYRCKRKAGCYGGPLGGRFYVFGETVNAPPKGLEVHFELADKTARLKAERENAAAVEEAKAEADAEADAMAEAKALDDAKALVAAEAKALEEAKALVAEDAKANAKTKK